MAKGRANNQSKSRQLQQQIRRRRIAGVTVSVLAILAILGVIWFGVAAHSLEKISDKEAAEEREEALQIDKSTVTEQQVNEYTVDATKPRYLTISSIGLNKVRVLEVGLSAPNKDGSQQMGAPKGIHDAGWFNCLNNPTTKTRCKKFVAPGSTSTTDAAVIDGHSCSGDGCVFDNLGKVKNGDEVKVEMGDGKVYMYRTVKAEHVKLSELDMNNVLKPYSDGKPGLNLITCDGSWSARDSRGVRTMDERIVVYTELIS